MTEFARFDPVEPQVGGGTGTDRVPAGRRVDVWAFSLECRAGDTASWAAQLSDDELARAAKFKRAADRDAFVCAHGVTRQLLSRYCNAPPRALRFAQAAGGKPMLQSNSSGSDRVYFNLSHSAGSALLAVSRAGEVGVDLEAAREDVATSLADRFFCDAERRAIAAAPRRAEAFFRHWVAKEAVLKACGTGLAFPLDAFAVHFSADGDIAAVSSTHPQIASGDWLVRLLPLPPRWYGALCAAPGCDVRIRMPGGPEDR